jgi:hypothetical protein
VYSASTPLPVRMRYTASSCCARAAPCAWPRSPGRTPARTGDATSALLLRDAARLRDGAAPFRSLGHIAVAPRPYQLVPLIMARRLQPVRLLIADDVGVGKTIEAALIAREVLDRGRARRQAVFCPAHLCDQWERKLRETFALPAAVVQPCRIARLARDLPCQDLSIYWYYRYLVAGIDFVKTERHRRHFVDNAPDRIIAGEAHSAARPPTRPGGLLVGPDTRAVAAHLPPDRADRVGLPLRGGE